MKKFIIIGYNNNIKKIIYIYDVEKLKLPSNLSLFKDYAQIFKDHREILYDKLEFTMIISQNNIFNIFFNLFKKFYIPIKPLYLCKTIELANECIYDEEKRNKLLVLDTDN